jgi:uncharacterized protein YceH (UPF0502 family)
VKPLNGYLFRESAIEWLKQKEFSPHEIEELQNLMNSVGKSSGETFVKLPKDAGIKVSAMVYVLSSVVDESGKHLCFDEKGFIEIPHEAKTHYEDALSIEELEGTISRLRKIKVGRAHSSPKRRGSGKSERY